MNRKALAIPLIALFLATLALPSLTITSANSNYEVVDNYRLNCPRPPPPTPPKIKLLNWGRTGEGVMFTYRVTAGSKDVSHWILFSTVFRKVPLLSTSETPYEYNQKIGYIKFDKDILAGQSRDVSFTLKLSYVGLKLGCLPYEIKTSNSCYIGLVQGPLISR